MYYYLFLLLVILIPTRNIVLKVINVFDTVGLNIVNALYGVCLIGAVMHWKRDKLGSIFYPMFFWVLYFGLQIFFHPYNHDIFYQLQWWKDSYLFMIITFLFSALCLNDNRKILTVLILMCLVNLYMDTYFWRWVRFMNFDNFADKMKMINGTFGDVGGSNEWAAFFSTYTLILIPFIFHVKKITYKFALIVLIISNFFVLMFSFSRGAYLAIIVGLLHLFFKMKKIGFIILIISLPIFYQFILPTSVIERVEMSFSTNDYGEVDDQDVASRMAMWHTALERFSDAPIFGKGLLSFQYGEWNNPHNQHLNILLQGGVVGYALFIWLFLASYREACRLTVNGKLYEKCLGLGLSSAILSLFIANFFGDRWSYYVLTGYYSILLGIVCNLNSRIKIK